MGIFSLILSVLAISDGGANIVLLLSALGGLSGLAAVLTVFVNHRANLRKAAVDDKSVAITELEKAVPGMGDIIKEWQNIVHHLQEELHTSKEENVTLRAELAETRRELEDR